MTTESLNAIKDTINLKFALGIVVGIALSVVYNLDKTKTKKILLQKTTLCGILQVIIGLILMYTGHDGIGGILISSGFGCTIYQPREIKREMGIENELERLPR